MLRSLLATSSFLNTGKSKRIIDNCPWFDLTAFRLGNSDTVMFRGCNLKFFFYIPPPHIDPENHETTGGAVELILPNLTASTNITLYSL